MLSYEKIAHLLDQTGLPFAYHHFSEGESPDPPFLVYLTPGSHNFSADGMVYYRVDQLDIELYTDEKSPVTEERVEEILRQHHIFYNKSEVWIESERLYEVFYETEV